MRQLLRSGCFAGILVIGIASSVFSQPEPSANDAPTTAPNSTSTKAVDLTLPPRLGVGYSTSGGGYDGFTRFEGFVPLFQTPGKNVLFLEGRLLLDNGANLGGNLLVGYRTLNPAGDRLFGGYLSYDNRDTGNHTFSQLGFGLESLGELLDIRANAYLPIGNSRQSIGSPSFTTNNLQVSSQRFQDHYLLAVGTLEQIGSQQYEAAMGGVDLEVGTRLAKWESGNLRAYGGLYYYDAKGSSGFVGWRIRLEARPADGLTLGLAVQDDGRFGTNVVATLGLTFPSSRPKGADPNSLLARLGESPFRTGTVVVENQTQAISQVQAFTDTPVLNPATGQPYFFNHVILGASGGDGTFETPFGSVPAAFGATKSDGNDIVYVRPGTNPGIAGWAIPNRVQVLSTGPVQPLPTQVFQNVSTIQLPLSGQGTLPTVLSTITMGNDSTLSGFNIVNSPGVGVRAQNLSGTITIRDNQINRATDQGIFADTINGNLIVSNNIITNTLQVSVSTLPPVNLSGVPSSVTVTLPIGAITFTLPTSTIPVPNGQGIVANKISGTTSLTGNTISGVASQGMVVLNPTGTVTVTNNTISNTVGTGGTIPSPFGGAPIPISAGQGIILAGTTSTTVNVTGNKISNTNGQGILLGGIPGTVSFASNTIVGARDQGILAAGTSGTLTIANNTITDTVNGAINFTLPVTVTIPFPPFTLAANIPINLPTGQGIALAGTTGTVSVTGNTIERTGGSYSTPTLTGNIFIDPIATAIAALVPASGQGISLANNAGAVNLTIANNQIRSSFNDGMLLGLGGSSTGTVTISGNTVESNGGLVPTLRGDGIEIALEGSTVIGNLTVSGNTIRNNFDEGIDIRLGSGDSPTFTNSTANLTATVSNNAISGNGQNGIEAKTYDQTTAKLLIESNTVSVPNNFRGILLQTDADASSTATASLSANVRLNTLSGSFTPLFLGENVTHTTGASTMCLNLQQNTFGSFQITNVAGQTMNVVSANLATNSGTSGSTGTITPTTSCP